MPKVALPASSPGGNPVEFENVRTMVIVGANGSGKTRIGAQIEKTAGAKAHRLTAQRALTIPPFVQPRAFEQAESTLLTGNYDPGQKPENRFANKFSQRWGGEPFTRMLDDFEHLLALLFADEAKRSRDYTNQAFLEVPKKKPPPCKLDKLRQIWATVMPQRELTLGDDKVSTKTKKGESY